MKKTPGVFFLFALFLGFFALSAHAQLEGSAIEGGLPLLRRSATMQAAPQKDKLSAISSEVRGFFEAVNETTYVVGPGDYFQVIFGDKSVYVEVNSEGYVAIEAVAPVKVSGISLLQAKQAIQRGVSTQYRADKVHVTLAQAKVFQVSISGEVDRPGLYSFGAGTRLSQMMKEIGGFAFLGTQRLVVTSATGKTREVDLGEYFLNGNLEHNPYLNQGDRILATRLDFSGDIIYVRSEKRFRPMQIHSGESLEQILRRHQDFMGTWEWNSVKVFQGDKYLETVLRAEAGTYFPKPGVLIDVRNMKDVVFVGGTVVQPGDFAFDPRFSAFDYIAKAGITINTSKNLRASSIISADGKSRDINSSTDPIQPGDHIWVPRSTEAKTRDYIGLIASISSLGVAIATLFVLTGSQ